MAAEAELYEQLKDEGEMCSSTPENHINCEYVNFKWVPLFHGGNGSYIGIDFDPDSKGTRGQIINFGIDDEQKFVLANSLSEFLEFCIEIMQKGEDVNYNQEHGFYGYTDIYFPEAIAKQRYFDNA